MRTLWAIVTLEDTTFFELYMALLCITFGTVLMWSAPAATGQVLSQLRSENSGMAGGLLWLTGAFRLVGLVRKSYAIRRWATLGSAFLWIYLCTATIPGSAQYAYAPAAWSYGMAFVFNIIVYVRLRGQR